MTGLEKAVEIAIQIAKDLTVLLPEGFDIFTTGGPLWKNEGNEVYFSIYSERWLEKDYIQLDLQDLIENLKASNFDTNILEDEDMIKCVYTAHFNVPIEVHLLVVPISKIVPVKV